MSVSCNAEETRAIALAGMSFSYALAGVLKRTGVLGPEAMADAFEAALSGVENSFAPDDPSASLARQLLDLMSQQLTSVKPGSDQPRPMRPQRKRLSA